MKKRYFLFRELPITYVQVDPDHAREEFGIRSGHDRLMTSVSRMGIQQPIIVRKIRENTYRIIDGYRRYIFARHLGFKTLPCCIYPLLTPSELQRLRLEIQYRRREWSPLERADALKRIKVGYGLKTDRELAQYLGCPETLVSRQLYF